MQFVGVQQQQSQQQQIRTKTHKKTQASSEELLKPTQYYAF